MRNRESFRELTPGQVSKGSRSLTGRWWGREIIPGRSEITQDVLRPVWGSELQDEKWKGWQSGWGEERWKR